MKVRVKNPTLGACALALVLATATRSGRCESSAADKTAAEALFEDAKRLMAEGHVAEACPKLADSQRLDPGVGTLLNLALCYKNAGRTASSWAAYKEAAAAARDAGQSDREDIARAEAAALEPKLSHLTVAIAPETAALDARVSLDGEDIPKSAWGLSSPIDAGPHALDVVAPGKKPWHGDVTVGADGDTQSITVPVLEDAPIPPAAPAPATAVALRPARPPNKTLRTVGYVSAGVGVAAIGVGVYFGVNALSTKKSSDKQCDAGHCTPDGLSQYHDAQKEGVMADVSYGVGLAAIVVGTYLVVANGGLPFVTEKKKTGERKPALHLGGGVGPSGGAVVLRTVW